MVAFYCFAIDNVLMYCITVWYTSCSAADRKAVQRVINTIQQAIGCPVSSLEDISSTRRLSRAKKIMKEPPYSGQHLFNLLPSGRQYRWTNIQTNRVKTVSSLMPSEPTIAVNKGAQYPFCGDWHPLKSSHHKYTDVHVCPLHFNYFQCQIYFTCFNSFKMFYLMSCTF